MWTFLSSLSLSGLWFPTYRIELCRLPNPVLNLILPSSNHFSNLSHPHFHSHLTCLISPNHNYLIYGGPIFRGNIFGPTNTTNEPEQGCDTPFLIGKICSDKELNPRIVKATLTVAWNGVKLKGIHQLDNKTFSCSFGSEEDRNKILMGSPWFVKGQLFNLKRWSESSLCNIGFRYTIYPLTEWTMRMRQR